MERKANGFTLIELLISIAILSILVAMAIRVSFPFRKKAVVSQVQQELENCLGEFAAEFADKGVLSRTCFFQNSNSSCNFTLQNVNGYYIVTPNTCNVTINNMNVICTIEQFANKELLTITCHNR